MNLFNYPFFSNSKYPNQPKQRFWLVGASQGIGKSLAEQLLSDGHFVILSSRNACADLQFLSEKYSQQVQLINIDVSVVEPLAAICQQAWEAFDGLDYWFYNVAAYESTPLSNNHIEAYKTMMQINYQGFITMAHYLLPYFKRQKSGRWLVNGSISAHFGLPFGGGYSASKAALLNACQSLQPELKQQGINLQIINHGFVKTRLTAKNNFTMPFLLSPELAAHRIKDFMLKPVRHFELKFPWQMRLIFTFLNILPNRWSLALTAKLLPKPEKPTIISPIEENNP